MDEYSDMYSSNFDMMKAIAKAAISCDDSTAEDIVQDVFLDICKRRPEIKDVEKYLAGAATRKALEYKRNSKYNPINATDLQYEEAV